MYLTFSDLVAPSPWSAVLSILLLVGFDTIGLWFLCRLRLVEHGRLSALRFQGASVGAALLAVFLYPMALFQIGSGALFKAVACLLVIIGGQQLLQFLFKSIKPLVFRISRGNKGVFRNLSLWLAGAIMMAFFFLSLAPITNADALDYHMGVAVAINNQWGMPYSPEWFHSRLAGNGEVLNALGLTVGAEQFGSLLQFASLLGIVFLMQGASNCDWLLTWRRNSSLLFLAAVSAPVLLFLVSAPKPQLWPVSLTTFSFALLMHPSIQLLNRAELIKRYAFVCFLALVATQAKFNYLLGGGLVIGLGMLLLLYRGMWRPVFLITWVMLLLVIAPPIIWKAQTFSTSWIAALSQALPGHWPGTDQFIASARLSPDFTSKFSFPLSILVPSSLGGFSSVLGFGWLIVLGWRHRITGQVFLGLAATLLLVIINAVFAPPGARIYLEPYFWLMFLFAVGLDASGSMRLVKWLLYIQAGLVLLAAYFGVITLSVGALTDEWRETVMLRSANGYELMRWVDGRLPKSAVVLNSHRSMALLPREGVDASWIKFVDPRSAEASVYLDRVRQRAVTHILVMGAPEHHPLAGCFGAIIAGPYMAPVSSRNPFNREGGQEAWLFEFHSDRLPVCVGD